MWETRRNSYLLPVAPGQIVSTLESYAFLIIASPTPSRGGTTLASACATAGAQQSLFGKPLKPLRIPSQATKKYPRLKKSVFHSETQLMSLMCLMIAPLKFKAIQTS